MFGRKKEKEKEKQTAPAVSWEQQLAASGLMGLLSGGQAQQASFLVTGESVDVHVAPPPQATEKVSAVEKGEGKKLKSTIQGFNRQAISRPAAAQAPTGQTAAAAEEKQPLSGGLLGAPAPDSKGLERMKSREDLLAEKERAAKLERERALRERMQRKEEL
ncbi:uncharacterized protein ACA1_236300 [Acanthamoeba castellanii str. Neff]|uniref:Uncharacterized protein n=1 Tax=Acanthamoeba castellanii (strain ATCC 30010 / Neff) TaxID=1257118 RepID=L8H1G7_ACACF|nr:uncharacterized protein ACA1_236300 [Acanthamoeba castellanii str. Neff]ELR19062.1 hypothetical protein ACA1_236300 [Acanthamoeba castellanii str. Neff]